MKLLHFSDIHLTALGNTIGGRDPIENFNRGLEHALVHHSDAEALFITGDLSDWGEVPDYEYLKERIAKLPMPVILLIGNHDKRDVFLCVFPEYRGDNGFVQQSVRLSHGTAITLDTWGAESHAGHFCAQRAEWLDQQLMGLDEPVWLFLHHNLVPLGIKPIDQIMLLDADRLGAVLKKHKTKVRHIFHGHCHLPLSGSFHGIPFSAPRGTNHQGWPDFGATRLLAASDLPEAYGVILIQNDTVMYHMVEFGYKGEIRAEGSPDYANWDKLTMCR